MPFGSGHLFAGKLEDSPHKTHRVKDFLPGTHQAGCMGDLREWKQILGSRCKVCCMTEEKLALWKPGRKGAVSRHVGIAQRLAPESEMFCALLFSSVRLPVSNSSPGRMQCASPGSGSGRQVGAESCWFCASPEGDLEGVECQSVLIQPALWKCQLASPQRSVRSQVSAWLQHLCDYHWWFSILYIFMKMSIKIVMGALCASFSTWEQMVCCRTASVPDTFVFVTWFSPRAIYAAGITCMKWDLKLRNLDTVIPVRSSDTVLFFP